MIRDNETLLHATDGAASVEFVIIAPFLILLLIGILQTGMLLLAQNGLQQGVEAGARYATIYPRPTDSQISAKILASGYGMSSSAISSPTFSHGTTSLGTPYVDITMKYSMTPNFIFFKSAPIHLSHSRRAFQALAA